MAIDFTFPPEVEEIRFRVRDFIQGTVKPLEQEIEELSKLAQSGRDRDDTAYDNAAELFLDFMNTAVAGDDEAFVSMVEDQLFVYSGGEGRSFNPVEAEILEAVVALEVQPGRARTTTLRTQGTTLRMLVADVQLPGETRHAQFVVLNDLGSQRAQVNRQVLTYAGVSLVMLLVGGTVVHLALGRLLAPQVPEFEDLLRMAYGSEDFHAAVRAFADKRKPVFRGK